MGRINQLTPTTIVTTDSVIAVDAANGGVTNKLTINTLAGGLRVIGNYATQTQLAAKQDVLTFDDAPEEDSENPVTSGGIYNAIGSAMSNVYTKAETDNAIAQRTATNDPALLTSFDASKRIVFTPTSGQSQASYGGCWYGKIGTRVYLHIGMTGLTANAAPVTVFTLPTGYRPIADMVCLGAGGASYTSIAIMSVNTAGVVRVNSQDAYARIDMMFDALS